MLFWERVDGCTDLVEQADKLNRDHQELEAYWKRKEPGPKEKEQGDQE